MGARWFALAAGVFFGAFAIVASLPATVDPPIRLPQIAVAAGYGVVLGVFPVNILHVVVDAVAAAGGLAAFARPALARPYARVLAWGFGSIAVLGLLPRTHTLFGVMPIFGHDVWLHGLIAVAAAVAVGHEAGAAQPASAADRPVHRRRTAA